MPGIGEDALDAGPQQRGVLGDHDAHGSTAVTIVGPVAGLDTVNVPRAARTRSSSPRSPVASSSVAAVAPPTPSSNTETYNVAGRLVVAHGDDRLAGVRVFGDVGQRLGDDEVRHRFDLVGKALG